MLRTQPVRGRVPSADEADRTLLLGYGVWTDVYEGDPEILGRTVELDGRARTIVGVMPEGFGFPFNENAWVVFGSTGTSPDPIELVGRLAPGASMEDAEQQMAALWARLDETRPADRANGLLTVEGFTGGRGEGGEAVAFVGLVLVALCLLLIACANVANLLLVRASERIRALGIQAALGAARSQIGLQLFLEAALIAAVGGAFGLVLAGVGVDAIERALAAEHFGYHWMEMAIDGRVVLFTAILVGLTAMVAGMLPILRIARVDLQRVLKEEGSGSAMAGGGSWGRVFVTAQLALSCGALAAAGLTARSMTQNRGFGESLDTERVLMAVADLEDRDAADRPGIVDAISTRMSGLPGVRAAGVGLGAPAFREPWGTLEFDGEVAERVSDRERGNWNAIDNGYLTVLGLDVLEGRAFSAQDVRGSAPVALVNEAFVARFSADRDVLGRTVRIGSRPDSAAWHTIVGVVEDARVTEGERIRHDRVYVPLAQADAGSTMILLRSTGDAAALAPSVRAAVAEIDPGIALWSVRTLADGHAFMIRIPRAMGSLALGGGLAGLLVAAVGLYGLLSFRVRQRRAELGVRLALGADGSRLARETLRFALGQLVPAVVIGLTLAWLAAPILAIMLLGLDPRSPSTFAAVAVAFLAVGLVAAGVPAWRASLTDPARALRSD